MTETLAVVVVVVTHNSATHVDALLDSLPRALCGLSYSVVVVDNGSHDATVDLVSRRTDCRLVESVNDGFAAGVNRGVKSSLPSRTLLVLNPDAALDAGSGRAMLAVLERRGAGVVVPRIRSSDGELYPSLRRAPTLLRVGGLSFTGLALFAERIDAPASYTQEHVVDWATGAVMLIDRTCYEELGGLDESYFLYSEETDFCLRASDAGWPTVYTPDAGAMHVGGGSGRNARTHTMQMINRVRLYRRRAGAMRAGLYLVGSVLVELRRALLGSRASLATVRALVIPSARPDELSAREHLVPR